MPNTDHDPMGSDFEWRLKAALDRVTPPASTARYATRAMSAARAWPVGPGLVAAGATAVLLAVTATAATGSPNPVVWAERAGTTIQSVGHSPVETVPSPEPSPEQPAQPSRSAPAGPAQAAHDPDPEVQQGEPQQDAEPRQAAEPAEPSDPPIHVGDHNGPRVPPTPPPD